MPHPAHPLAPPKTPPKTSLLPVISSAYVVLSAVRGVIDWFLMPSMKRGRKRLILNTQAWTDFLSRCSNRLLVSHRSSSHLLSRKKCYLIDSAFGSKKNKTKPHPQLEGDWLPFSLNLVSKQRMISSNNSGFLLMFFFFFNNAKSLKWKLSKHHVILMPL